LFDDSLIDTARRRLALHLKFVLSELPGEDEEKRRDGEGGVLGCYTNDMYPGQDKETWFRQRQVLS
jgi:hypothetical protein